MRCVIAGGRDFDDAEAFAKAITFSGWADAITVVLSGACKLDKKVGMKRPPYAHGADGFGERWADLRGITLERYFADWFRSGKFDRAEGPKRNRLMASLADAVILLPGGDGTASMRREAKRHGLHIYPPEAEEPERLSNQTSAASPVEADDVPGGR